MNTGEHYSTKKGGRGRTNKGRGRETEKHYSSTKGGGRGKGGILKVSKNTREGEGGEITKNK